MRPLADLFTQKIGRYLLAHGRRLWSVDEIMQPGLSSARFVSLACAEAAHAAAIRGNYTVLARPLRCIRHRKAACDRTAGSPPVSSLENVYRLAV